MASPRRIRSLFFSLVAAGALLLLAFLPHTWSSNRDTAHPVSGYARMHKTTRPPAAVPDPR